MILLAAIAFRLVSTPVSAHYAYTMLGELMIETAALYAYALVFTIALLRANER